MKIDIKIWILLRKKKNLFRKRKKEIYTMEYNVLKITDIGQEDELLETN